MGLQIIYNMYKEELALNNLQGLICHKTQPNQSFLNNQKVQLTILNNLDTVVWFQITNESRETCVQSPVKSYQRLKIWYLMLPCFYLAL